jgi:hypothetical protein
MFKKVSYAKIREEFFSLLHLSNCTSYTATKSIYQAKGNQTCFSE